MIPAYIRIHDVLKKKIDDGFWEIGQRLPSERDLADDYEVSRMTLRQAITLLVEEGILERRVGSGTYVDHVIIFHHEQFRNPHPMYQWR